MFKVGERLTVMETTEDFDGYHELDIGEEVELISIYDHGIFHECLVCNGHGDQFSVTDRQLGNLNNDWDKEKLVTNINKEIEEAKAQAEYFMGKVVNLMGLDMSLRGE